MKQLLIALMLMFMTNGINAQPLDVNKTRAIQHQLDDVMEITDTAFLKQKLKEVEKAFEENATEINKTRLGIIYHEVALTLGFFSKEYKGYSQKAYDVLTEIEGNASTIAELLPFVSSYRGSALSLVSAETRKLKLLGEAFTLLNAAVQRYSDISYAPEFLRGSVAENLPWLFFGKRKYAQSDFQSIITKQQDNSEYADWKIMSFTYWAWANQHQSKKDRATALRYLDRAIVLDPEYKAGRKKAEELRAKLMK